MTIKYVLSADHYMMYSVAHDPVSIWDLINWWEQVNRDLCVGDQDRYVQLVDFRNVHSVHVNHVELDNFISRVRARPERLPARSAVWANRDTVNKIRHFREQSRHGLTQQILAFTDLDVACHWLGAKDYHVRQADVLFDNESVVLS
jgi:hypothetical protein